ncbi:hypothetical protein OB969_16625 [Bacillus cereus]|nr:MULTISPECIES: hypothetical protein [Bacillus cereus group]MCU5052244.1 hypothetical protein [Bacillus cereus]MCU5064819.1 hypothetical protein [Bacillus cereus]MCU5146299.1 hypothetical protein [Bacillus cereus]MCU5191903.1 hypothetical protein [Bacillus cereus]MCU5496360.1 hypothetical protein [Bacillus cereus]
MREYFGFISMFLTGFLFFNLYFAGPFLILIPISIVLAIFAPKGTAKTFAFVGLIIFSIFLACIYIFIYFI